MRSTALTSLVLVVFSAATAACLGDMSGSQRGSYGGGGPIYDSESSSGTPTTTSRGPEFGETIRQEDAPPPLSGGTMTVARDGTVVVADPDRDLVYVVKVVEKQVRTIALEKHDEPGRVVAATSGHVYVVLRRAGMLATIDLASATVTARREVCTEPRGVALDRAEKEVLVACAGGELVTLPPISGALTDSHFVRNDLRDVVVTGRATYVSTFRNAEVVRLDADKKAQSVTAHGTALRQGHVAWRMIEAPNAQIYQDPVALVAQDVPTTDVEVPAQYYDTSAGCSSTGPLTVVRTPAETVTIPAAVLPIDVAMTPASMAIVSAGNGHSPGLPTLVLVDRTDTAYRAPCPNTSNVTIRAQLTSVAYASDGVTLYAFSRMPARLYILPDKGAIQTIELSSIIREDTGHAVFHSNSGLGLACASCHPEGRDDGHAWLSRLLGGRRTPSLVGTVAGTAPYHWNGEAKDMSALLDLTFSSRMKGPMLSGAQGGALEGWLVAQPALRSSPRDPSAVARGAQVFASSAAHCSVCHAGELRTDNSLADVGTGGTFQIPSLVNVGFRPPYFHDGRMVSLRKVVESGHGKNKLTPAQTDDLLLFLESL